MRLTSRYTDGVYQSGKIGSWHSPRPCKIVADSPQANLLVREGTAYCLGTKPGWKIPVLDNQDDGAAATAATKGNEESLRWAQPRWPDRQSGLDYCKTDGSSIYDEGQDSKDRIPTRYTVTISPKSHPGEPEWVMVLGRDDWIKFYGDRWGRDTSILERDNYMLPKKKYLKTPRERGLPSWSMTQTEIEDELEIACKLASILTGATPSHKSSTQEEMTMQQISRQTWDYAISEGIQQDGRNVMRDRIHREIDLYGTGIQQSVLCCRTPLVKPVAMDSHRLCGSGGGGGGGGCDIDWGSGGPPPDHPPRLFRQNAEIPVY